MAETIRIEVVDVSGGSSTSSASAQATTSGAGGTQGQGGGPYTSSGNNPPPSSYAANQSNADRQQRRPRRADEVPLEGRGWRHYLNRQMPYASFAVDNFQNRQENRFGWVRDMMGLPDRLERAMIRAQHKAFSAGDPNSLVELLKIQGQYRAEKFQGMVAQAGNWISGMAQWTFAPYKSVANDTLQFGQGVKTATTYIGGFVALLGAPKVGAAIGALGKIAGTILEVVGFAQGKLSEEAGRVRGFSPELRMQGVVAGLRELKTDIKIAQDFGAQMARQLDQESRREAAWRLFSTSLAAGISKPFEQMNEAVTSSVEALAGQRPWMDAMTNIVAAIPGSMDWVKKSAERRNEEFKERMGQQDIQNGKELCLQILNALHPGEEKLRNAVAPPPKAKMAKRQVHEAAFGGGDFNDLLK